MIHASESDVREKVLTEEQKEPMKAMFAFETLVHPDHPLRRKGHDGIELSIGALLHTTISHRQVTSD